MLTFLQSSATKVALCFLLLQCLSFDLMANPYSVMNGDTLRIGNHQAEYVFIITEGKPGLYSMLNMADGLRLTTANPAPLFRLGEETLEVLSYEGPHTRSGQGQQNMVPTETEFVFHYTHLSVKMILSIWPETKAIEISYFLKANNNALDFTADQTSLFQYHYPQRHLHFTAVEFVDQTDRYNNLVHKKSATGFTHPYPMKGIVLEIEDQITGIKQWVIKKAPCSNVQLHYPGYDFLVSNNAFEVAGAGILPEDLVVDEWIPVYGIVLGAPVQTELHMRIDMRTYLKNSHLSDPKDLEMVMMNTWGDRNRDASIGETFIKNEIDAAQKLGITHFQIDDGWQRGKSMNSADTEGNLWESWTYEDWQPSPERFPNGLGVVAAYAYQNNVKLGLWFNPSRTDNYANWETDANIVIRLYNEYGIRFFKIDGIELPTKRAEINLRKFYEKVQAETGNAIVFNIDATAGNRGGYFFLNDHGNIFLENRYTDWANYYPYQTLRNLWMLSAYVPPEKLQIEFLNIWRNDDKYDKQDPFRPYVQPFEYVFATTMMAQPLAWLEGSRLPAEAYSIRPVIEQYTRIQHALHQGFIFPLGDEPSGRSWTGFQSMGDKEGFFLIFRENNPSESQGILAHDLQNKVIFFEAVLGSGKTFTANTSDHGIIEFTLPGINTYALYKYTIIEGDE